jgi:hypothetical protein
MKYRQLTASGDYMFGRLNSFLVDTPETVAQAIKTRLALWTNEWFLDKTEGTDYIDKILGTGTQGTRDAEIKGRILGTPGVVEILKYSSSVDARQFIVSATVRTEYGDALVEFNTGN